MKAIAAMSLNRVIGRDNKIPWHLPEDFRWFKELTTGQFILMGRKTFDSLGKPLPNRTNIVVTRDPEALAADPRFVALCGDKWRPHLDPPAQLVFDDLTPQDLCLVRDVDSFAAAYEQARPSRELYIIGGAQIYARLLDRCTDLYLSVVQQEVEGDAFFPEFEDRWRLHDIPLRTADFEVRHFRNPALQIPGDGEAIPASAAGG